MAVYEHSSSKTHIQITSSSPPSVAPCDTRMMTMMAGMGVGREPAWGWGCGLSGFM